LRSLRSCTAAAAKDPRWRPWMTSNRSLVSDNSCNFSEAGWNI
jgi:hypothetical protein